MTVLSNGYLSIPENTLRYIVFARLYKTCFLHTLERLVREYKLSRFCTLPRKSRRFIAREQKMVYSSELSYFFGYKWFIFDTYRLIHGLFHIALAISTRPWYRPRWKGQYEKGHVLIYLSHNLLGQITCYCPRKMLLPLMEITRRKLCFYYTCKVGVSSIKYVIIFIT